MCKPRNSCQWQYLHWFAYKPVLLRSIKSKKGKTVDCMSQKHKDHTATMQEVMFLDFDPHASYWFEKNLWGEALHSRSALQCADYDCMF